MRKYIVEVPIYIEFVSLLDKHDSVTFLDYDMDTELTIESVKCKIVYHSSDSSGIIALNNLSAKDEHEAFEKSATLLNFLAHISSLQFQKQNGNQHYGHARLVWYVRELKITPRDQSISESFSMKVTVNFGGREVQLLAQQAWGKEDLTFLLETYYGSLQSLDYKAKYYHAFSIMEYLEKEYADMVGTKRFSDVNIMDATGKLLNELKQKGYSGEDLEAAKGSVISSLKKITKESRVEKLYSLLVNYYGIKTVRYYDDVLIDRGLVDSFIKTRNRLFHGGNNPSDLKKNTDLLILITEKVILSIAQNNGCLIK